MGAHLKGRQSGKPRGRQQPKRLHFSSSSPAPNTNSCTIPPNTPGGLDFHPYDDSQPAPGIEVAAIEVLASWDCVLDAMVGVRDGAEDEIDLVHELETPSARCW
jgi:hypothetical protein